MAQTKNEFLTKNILKRLKNLLPQGSGINGEYEFDTMNLFPPEEDDMLVFVSNSLENNPFCAIFTYRTKEDSLSLDCVSSMTLRPKVCNHLEELFSEVAKEYNKLYCNVEDNQKQENYGE